MPGMWDFPMVQVGEGSEGPGAVGSDLSGRWGLRATSAVLAATVRHTITHHRIRVDVYAVDVRIAKAWKRALPEGVAEPAPPAGGSTDGIVDRSPSGRVDWVEASALDGLPLTGIARKIRSALEGAGAATRRRLSPRG